METKLLDCTKLECPMPVIKAKQELEKDGEMLLDVIVDNEIAVQNLTKLANSMGYKSSSKKQDENFCVSIEKTINTSLNQDKSNLKFVEERQTILIKTSFLGIGDDSLGSTLMKGFIFTLTQSKPLPKKVMFLNSGVKLTTENEETVKNLQILEKEGTEIVSCGTCLDFYNLKDKLKVYGGGFRQDIFYQNDTKKEDDIIRLLYVGKISSSKGIFELVQTFPKLNEKYENLEFNIVGNCNEEQMEELTKLSKNATNMHIYSTMPQNKLADLMRSMDIFVLPSYYEGLGLVNIEALACGMRVVTTPIEGLIYLLGDTINNYGLIKYVKLPRLYDVDKAFEEDKPQFIEDLVKEISSQIESIKRKETVSEEIMNMIKEHSWEGIVHKVDSDIKRL